MMSPSYGMTRARGRGRGQHSEGIPVRGAALAEPRPDAHKDGCTNATKCEPHPLASALTVERSILS